MFCDMGQELMQHIYNSFVEKVFFRVDWRITRYIADNLSNTSPGYSFVSGAWNSKYYQWRAFIDKIIETPHLREEFVIAVLADRTPLLNLL